MKNTSLVTGHTSLAFLRWLVFSALWFLGLLLLAQFRMVGLWAGVAALLGFLTDCLIDVLAARSHQRKMGREYRKRFEASESESETGYSVHKMGCPYEHGGACTCR